MLDHTTEIDLYSGLPDDVRGALERVPDTRPNLLALRVGEVPVFRLTFDPLGHRPDRPLTTTASGRIYVTERTVTTGSQIHGQRRRS